MEEPKFEPVPEETAEAPAEPAALPAADEALIPEMPEEPAAPAEDPMVEVCDVQFRSGSKVYFFAPGELKIATGDEVILETARGPEFGQCVRGNHMVHPREVTPPLRPILRLATQQDKRVHAENCRREKRAMDVCQQKIADLGLEMQLVSAEYAFDGSKVLFFFTADGRVDFRELVKSLASVLRTRIELRQIGVRDKAKMVGGLGICGRPFCCRQFLDDFQPVSIKMAKTQNLSLNPTKISGTCGRLMCCLNYEQETYEELLKTSPKNESFVDTPDGRGTVTEVNLLKQCVRVRLEQQPDTIVCHHNCDICVLRNGKARKTDPPIPDDLAPISGNPQKCRKRRLPSSRPISSRSSCARTPPCWKRPARTRPTFRTSSSAASAAAAADAAADMRARARFRRSRRPDARPRRRSLPNRRSPLRAKSRLRRESSPRQGWSRPRASRRSSARAASVRPERRSPRVRSPRAPRQRLSMPRMAARSRNPAAAPAATASPAARSPRAEEKCKN